jgi:putative NADPH-quinone reductase
MPTVCIIQGHPDAKGRHLCHGIAQAYADGARTAGARVRKIDIAAADFPLLRDPADFLTAPPQDIQAAQEVIHSADHLAIVYPLWLGTMPGVVKGFFEQLCRNNFAISADAKGGWPRQMLKGKSARVIVTMGMPATVYKLMFGAHGVRGFEASILGMAGIKPIGETLIGGAGELTRDRAEAIFARIRRLGEKLT